MRVVFALGGRPQTQFSHFGIPIKSFLVSFHYKSLLKYIEECPLCDYLILDSGAFSAWSVGAEIDINKYIEWISYVKEKFKHIKRIECVNLDVITSRTDSKETLHKAYDKSMANLYFLRQQGHNAIPVHHQFEPFSILETYQKDFDFICISPNNREHTNSKRSYLDHCFSIIKGTRKTHGLAVTAESLCFRYPWFSVDSSIAQTPYRYGRMGTSTKKIGISDKENISRNFPYLNRLAHETIKSMMAMEKTATNLWKKRGIAWEI